MREWIVSVLLLLGSALSLLAAVGLVRLPDLYTRMQAATKAGTLGIILLAASVAAHFASMGVTARVLLIIFFVFLTAPVAAHVIARAAYSMGVELWSGTRLDEWRGSASDPGKAEGGSSAGASGSPNPEGPPADGAGRTPP
jgi:multicomponent Na+:H+ antiporter subunit G